MKVVLATGIYPPDIGGPATYVRHLAEELSKKGVKVVVVTYGSSKFKVQSAKSAWSVIRVAKRGPLLRWWRYARVLRKCGKDADVVYAFSSVSCGVPLRMACLKKPKKVLRLGGDFFWERYTDRGGMMGLREWYESHPQSQKAKHPLLNTFDYIVFSSRFQEEIYEKHFTDLPRHSVIENALPKWKPIFHEKHKPFRLLFVGRFVGFKNLPTLLHALERLPDVTLTLVGDGPMKAMLRTLTQELALQDRVTFVEPVHEEEKRKIFDDHDLMVIPSITEISPNSALEARAAGLPVLLTNETGLSGVLATGMLLKPMRDSEQIIRAITDAMHELHYEDLADDAELRPWQQITEETLSLFRSLL